MENNISLVVFLGNPGERYEYTRHNAGRLFAQTLLPNAAWQKKFSGLYLCQNGTPENPVKRHFLMPETFMNRSGESVAQAASFFKIPPEAILVVHDELELPLGKTAFKSGGGLGGHNGLRSIAAALGSQNFHRLRIGIGRPGGLKEKGQDISAWVLSPFTPPERALLPAAPSGGGTHPLRGYGLES